jgi:uridine kinase
MQQKVIVRFATGVQREYPKNISLWEISKEFAGCYPTAIVAAKVNNDITDLQASLNTDCTVDFLDLTSADGIKVYERSLTFVMIAAAQDLFPDGEVTVEHSLSKGLYCEIHLGTELAADDVQKLQARMREIVAEDRPIVRKVLAIKEAIELFAITKQAEKVKLLQQLKREKVSIYYCGEAYDYFYGTMVPSTGYIKLFDLKFYAPGLILRFPQKDDPVKLPPFTEQPKLAQIFLEAEQWGQILRCGYVATLNEQINNNNIKDIIRVAEALHEKKLGHIADFIADHRQKVRVILVAGPSSSGKTTFAHRLNIHLRVNGVRPVPISLDDYFLDRADTPRDEYGNYDFEAIEALDLELFNEHLTRILKGEEVKIPSYNFLTGQREYRGHKILIDNDQPLIIEGIHGLNERLTAAIPRELKVKIYISALTQLSIDNHNRITTTDTRLLRRIVRDSQFRAHDALKTLKIWPSVRRGEERNIFPYQEEADIMFNTALIYELAVLKKYAEPLLSEIGPAEPEYSEAKRLLNFLAFFTGIEDEDEIPPNSILREFTGKSCFY